MPIKMGTSVQSVVIGHSVYIGGGSTDNVPENYTVMKLNLQLDEWTKLPQYSAKWFAMTSLDNQVVLVGGLDQVTGKQIAVFTSERWISPYPPMNTARDFSTAVCFNNFIIIAGGRKDQLKRTPSVKILDLTSRRWYIAESLPNPLSSMKSTLI